MMLINHRFLWTLFLPPYRWERECLTTCNFPLSCFLILFVWIINFPPRPRVSVSHQQPCVFMCVCSPVFSSCSGVLSPAVSSSKWLFHPERMQQPLRGGLRRTMRSGFWPPGDGHQTVPGWRHLVRDTCQLRRWVRHITGRGILLSDVWVQHFNIHTACYLLLYEGQLYMPIISQLIL